MKASKTNFYSYNPRLKNHSRNLRNHGTKAEACLWKYVLRARNMKDYQFRRQRPVLDYIVDFMCKELMLIIEVDGEIHSLEKVMAKDIKRQIKLEDAGFTIMRFSNEEVLTDINGVYQAIEDWINKLPNPPGSRPGKRL